MKRRFVILIAGILFIATGFSSLSFAQGNTGMKCDKSMTGKDMMKSNMMAKGEMMGKSPMQAMLMKAMMEKSIIATTDGGVIVLVGNKLIKYDKNLNVMKEVEIKIDMEAMQKDMMEMMKKCPMAKDGMMGAGMAGDNPTQNVQPASGTDEKSK